MSNEVPIQVQLSNRTIMAILRLEEHAKSTMSPKQIKEQQDAEYNPEGAAMYSCIVLVVYAVSIVFMILSVLKRKRDAPARREETNHVLDYLEKIPYFRDKTDRDNFRRLKFSIIASMRERSIKVDGRKARRGVASAIISAGVGVGAGPTLGRFWNDDVQDWERSTKKDTSTLHAINEEDGHSLLSGGTASTMVDVATPMDPASPGNQSFRYLTPSTCDDRPLLSTEPSPLTPDTTTTMSPKESSCSPHDPSTPVRKLPPAIERSWSMSIDKRPLIGVRAEMYEHGRLNERIPGIIITMDTMFDKVICESQLDLSDGKNSKKSRVPLPKFLTVRKPLSDVNCDPKPLNVYDVPDNPSEYYPSDHEQPIDNNNYTRRTTSGVPNHDEVRTRLPDAYPTTQDVRQAAKVPRRSPLADMRYSGQHPDNIYERIPAIRHPGGDYRDEDKTGKQPKSIQDRRSGKINHNPLRIYDPKTLYKEHHPQWLPQGQTPDRKGTSRHPASSPRKSPRISTERQQLLSLLANRGSADPGEYCHLSNQRQPSPKRKYPLSVTTAIPADDTMRGGWGKQHDPRNTFTRDGHSKRPRHERKPGEEVYAQDNYSDHSSDESITVVQV